MHYHLCEFLPKMHSLRKHHTNSNWRFHKRFYKRTSLYSLKMLRSIISISRQLIHCFIYFTTTSWSLLWPQPCPGHWGPGGNQTWPYFEGLSLMDCNISGMRETQSRALRAMKVMEGRVWKDVISFDESGRGGLQARMEETCVNRGISRTGGFTQLVF